MPVSHVTPAIVLRARPLGESDKIVSFLTESHGKITGIAKGAKRSRRRFVNSLEPLSLVNLRFQERQHSSLALILESELTFGFKHLLASLEKISFAFYLTEITDGLIGEREENRQIFEHLRDSLRYLEENPASLRFLTTFELKLLWLAGYQPVLDRCKKCNKARAKEFPVRWYFSPQDGGILCLSCSRSGPVTLPIGSTALDALANLEGPQGLPSSLPTLSASAVKEIRAVISQFIQFHTDREIKSASLLYEFSAI
jgi:DNA repair protein RecO (recombination protein O)